MTRRTRVELGYRTDCNPVSRPVVQEQLPFDVTADIRPAPEDDGESFAYDIRQMIAETEAQLARAEVDGRIDRAWRGLSRVAQLRILLDAGIDPFAKSPPLRMSSDTEEEARYTQALLDEARNG